MQTKTKAFFTKEELDIHRRNLIVYMLDKVSGQDWHGVSDAANDLREIDVQLKLLRDLGFTA